MSANVETLSGLERRLSMSVPVAEVEKQIDTRLKQLARTVKMPGFRPGKVPMKLVSQQYGPQVRSEVISDAVQKAFGDAVQANQLRVAGYPRIEPSEAANDQSIEFKATFEVYPEFQVGDVSDKTIERPVIEVGDAEIDKTIEILRKQRQTFVAAEHPATNGDRVTMDFLGTLDDVPFDGGQAEGFSFVLGEGRMLPEFEAAALGTRAGDEKTFDLKFPDDYHGKEVAGKTVQFKIKVHAVDAAQLPAIDTAFAQSLGVADGDVSKMREEIKGNVEREVAKRVKERIKSQALDVLYNATVIELPKVLVESETQHLVQQARADLEARGMKLEQMPFDPTLFEASAKRRVGLGLIVAELSRQENLQPKPDQVRKLIDEQAQSYESPAEVVKWFYMQPDRLKEMEGMALEENVVNYVLGKAKVEDKAQAFDALMGGAA